MNANYLLTPRAQKDLILILEDVEDNFGETVADKVTVKFEKTFQFLATHIGVGQHRPEFAPPPWRFWPLGPSLIAFRSDVSPIWIAAIARAARDWRGIELDDPSQY